MELLDLRRQVVALPLHQRDEEQLLLRVCQTCWNGVSTIYAVSILLESRLMLIDYYEHHHAFGRDCNASEGLEQGHC